MKLRTKWAVICLAACILTGCGGEYTGRGGQGGTAVSGSGISSGGAVSGTAVADDKDTRQSPVSFADTYRYCSDSCFYEKDSAETGLNQYDKEGNLIRHYNVGDAQNFIELLWVDADTLIYSMHEPSNNTAKLFCVPISGTEEGENLLFEESKRVGKFSPNTNIRVLRKTDGELIYATDDNIYKQNLEENKRTSLLKGDLSEEQIQIPFDVNTQPVCRDGVLLFGTDDGTYLLDVDEWKYEKIWGDGEGNIPIRMAWAGNRIYFETIEEDIYCYDLGERRMKCFLSRETITDMVKKINPWDQKKGMYTVNNITVFEHGGRLYMDLFVVWSDTADRENDCWWLLEGETVFSCPLDDAAGLRYEEDISEYIMLNYSVNADYDVGNSMKFGEKYGVSDNTYLYTGTIAGFYDGCVYFRKYAEDRGVYVSGVCAYDLVDGETWENDEKKNLPMHYEGCVSFGEPGELENCE